MKDYRNIGTSVCPACKVAKLENNDFCSKKCFDENKRIDRYCQWCNKAFQVIKCGDNRDQKFCSRSCRHQHHYHTVPSSKIDVSCAWCKKSSKRPRKAIIAHANYLCSKTCELAFNSHSKISQKCSSDGCVNIVNVSRKNDHERYCSRDCFKRSYAMQNFELISQKGSYTSNKSSVDSYDSIDELRRFKELDCDESVLWWDRCKDKIEWKNSEGVLCTYTPDITIKYDNGITVIEQIKGVIDNDTKLKIKAANIFYFHKRNVEFRVLFDRDVDKVENIVEYYSNDLGTFSRVTYDSIWMNIARMFAKRSTCNRLQVGAVIVDQKNERVLCLGYNGSHPGGNNGCDTLTPGACGCVHAEINAISHASESLDMCTVYVTTSPCSTCAKILISRRVGRVVYLQKYRNSTGIELLRNAGIVVDRYQDLVDYSCS